MIRVDRLGMKLSLAIVGLILVGIGGVYTLAYREFRQQYVQSSRTKADREAGLVMAALKDEMMADRREVLRKIVSEYPEHSGVERVVVLDRSGTVQYTSDHSIDEAHFETDDPACKTCHDRPPEERERSVVIELAGGRVLRSVTAIRNVGKCQECHDKKYRTNGVLVVDLPMEETLAQTESAMQRMAMGSALLAMLVLGGIFLVVRRLLLTRLDRFERTARAIAMGDLQRRVPVGRPDVLTSLETQFNTMADSVQGLLQQLEDQRAGLEKVMNSVDDGMVVLDPDLRIVATNATFAKHFARRPYTALAGTQCAAAGADGSGSCSLPNENGCPARRCFETGEVVTEMCRRSTADGQRRQEEIHASPVRDANGNVVQVVEVWRDVSGRDSAAARLATYERMASLGMLASGFSHEVNTPLASIGTCLETIARKARRLEVGSTDAMAISELVVVARTQIERCGTITRQFLDLAGGKALARSVIDLNDACHLIARLIRPTARAAEITVHFAPNPGLSQVLANRASVQQVVINLVLNAISASERESRIDIVLTEDSEVQIQVIDQGCGIPSAEVASIFEPFRTSRPGGSGLGLFVSQSLAQGWGGEVRLVSSRVGQGSTFALVFPSPSKTEDLHG